MSLKQDVWLLQANIEKLLKEFEANTDLSVEKILVETNPHLHHNGKPVRTVTIKASVETNKEYVFF